jgi:hypothetical protein
VLIVVILVRLITLFELVVILWGLALKSSVKEKKLLLIDREFKIAAVTGGTREWGRFADRIAFGLYLVLQQYHYHYYYY